MPRRFPAPSLPAIGQRVTLDTSTSHHLLRVCVVPRGEAVVLFDGAGLECDGLLVDTQDALAVVEATSPARPTATGTSRVLLMGLPRKPAWERVLRMGTELGVTRFVAFPAERSVAKGLHPARWEKIVTAAAGQCGRGDVPVVHAVAGLAAALASLSGEGSRWMLTPGASAVLNDAAPAGAALLVGPEGGLSPAEVSLAAEAGFLAAGLGPLTLRADTAVVAALARLVR